MAIFKTVEYQTNGEYKEKGSKFIAFLLPIHNEIDIKLNTEIIRKAHPKSRHVCYAYRLRNSNNSIGYSDDGEPTNTAGIPILNQIKKHELFDVLIAIVRYFGGTLLGKGGLIRAYGSAAEDAIFKNKVIKNFDKELIQVEGNFNVYDKFITFVKQQNFVILNEEYSSIFKMKIEYPTDDKYIFMKIIEECGLKIRT